MTQYGTHCWKCGHKFNISTAKTRYTKTMPCHKCGTLAWYSIDPIDGKLVMVGREVKR